MTQLAIWTFDSLNGIVNGSKIAPTASGLRGTPALQVFFQDIDNNGKGGIAYNDTAAVAHGAGSAMAWNDIKGDGDDAEFRVTMDTRGFTALSLRFDVRADSADNFDLTYSVDGGYTFIPIQTNVTFLGNDAFHTVSVDMSGIAAIQNNPNVIFRFFDFSQDGNNALRFDNLEFNGTAAVPDLLAPVITFDNPGTTDLLSLNPTGRGWVTGALGDATDAAATSGISFALANTQPGFTVTATSSNQAVVPNGNLTLAGGAGTELLKILPTGVGSTDITVTVTNPGGHTDSYVVTYFASGQATDATHTLYHTGAADGSAAIAIDANYMLDGNDENQIIGVYDRNHSGGPIKTFDFGPLLGLPGQPREVDIEDATKVGNRVYWMGSQSNNSSGDDQPNRDTVFSTDLSGTGAATNLTLVNKYTGLESDLVNWDHTNGHGLGVDYFGFQAGAGAGGIPETANGFNIEGLTMAPNGTTAYLAFRAPVKDIGGGHVDAVIVPVTNFTTIVDTGAAPGAATFGAPIMLDLGGRGFRSIESDGAGHYVILAGPSAGSNDLPPTNFALYTWDGVAGHAAVLHNADINTLHHDFGDGSPEGIVAVPAGLNNGSVIQIIIDNGDTDFFNNGVSVKDTPQSTLQKFASQFVTLGGTDLSVTIDQAPAQADPTATASVDFNVVFNGPATGFTNTDVVLSGTAGATTAVVTQGADNAHYTVTVTGMTQSGTVIATIPAGAATDSVGFISTASTSTDNTVTYNAPVLNVTINQAPAQADPTATASITYAVVFSDTVTGFDQTDIVLSGTAGATTAAVVQGVDAAHYTVTVTGMTQAGTVIATIPASAATHGATVSAASTSTDNTVTYTPPNNAPSGADHVITTNEDTAYTFAASDFGFTDTDGNTLLAVKIATLPAAGTLTDNGAPVTVGQFIPLADLTGNKLIYTPTANANGNSVASFTFQVQDNGGTANGGQDTDQSANTIAINLTAVNDPPTVTVPGSIIVTEDVASALTGISFGDIDAGAGTVLATLSVPSGSLTASSAGGVTVGGTPSALTLSGTVAAINAFIAGSAVTYTTAQDATANVILIAHIDDQGNTGAGGPLTNTQAVTLTVTAVNDAPTAITPSGAIAVNEFAADGTAIATFTASDPDNTTFTWSLTGNPSDRFAIDSTGHLTVADGLLLDFEAGASHQITVRATDAGGLYKEQAFTVTVNDVNPETVVGDARNNVFHGGAGADNFTGGAGADGLFGGGGADTFHYLATSDSTPASYDALLDFQTGVDHIDIAALGATGVAIVQNGGSSFLFADTPGGSFQLGVTGALGGNDINTGTLPLYIVGDGAANTLMGGKGGDVMTGGAGADIFKFAAGDSPSSGGDDITDFQTGIDKIDLRGTGVDSVGVAQLNGINYVFGAQAGTVTFVIASQQAVVLGDILTGPPGPAPLYGAIDHAVSSHHAEMLF